MTTPKKSSLFIGLMSGTSMDGIDGVLADFSGQHPHTLAFAHEPYDEAIRAELLALQAPCDNELERAMLAGNVLAEGYAVVAHELLQRAGLKADDIQAIGAHGQTIRHQPKRAYTVQLLNAALLVERTRIAVVHDFRSRDIAAGGQGAPLVPAFHAARFAVPGKTEVVCNIGGIANITVLSGNGDVINVKGFDTGPGNCLLDVWATKHLGTPYDAHGEFAAKGKVHAALLADLMAEHYFYAPPPKSTGRDLFHTAWLETKLAVHPLVKPVDVQATLTELTARSITDAVKEHATDATQLWLCGGGAYNRELVKRITHYLPHCKVGSTEERGVPPMHVEALAFAWLARQHVEQKTIDLLSVTGVLRENILGKYNPK